MHILALRIQTANHRQREAPLQHCGFAYSVEQLLLRGRAEYGLIALAEHGVKAIGVLQLPLCPVPLRDVANDRLMVGDSLHLDLQCADLRRERRAVFPRVDGFDQSLRLLLRLSPVLRSAMLTIG